ncbi:MAG TPA: MFS transporter [Gaiellaceae bacterium]|nr:MFS transporter [Gaiellaceae bacterium]
MRTEEKRSSLSHVVERLTHGHEHHGQRWQLHLPLDGEPPAQARTLLFALGLPTFGLAFAISVLTTYGPVVLIRLTDSTSQVGALLGGEGAFALVVPLLSGALSDRLHGSGAARRVPFVLAGAPLVIAGLVFLPLTGSIALAAVAVLAFFVGYYLYYPPYRALYADLLPRRLYARAQADQAVLRGAGLGAALLAGGLLLAVWRPLPFTIGAAIVVGTTLALAPLLRLERSSKHGLLPYETVSLRQVLLGSRDLRTVAVANALWEFSFSGLKSFIVLYLVRGLGRSPSAASAVIAIVAVAYVAGAPLAGRLADRHGIVPVLRVSSLVYGAGLFAGVFPHTLVPLLIGLPFVALAGAVVMTLPQALAFTLAPLGSAGAAAGLLDFSRGLGVVLGPIVVGAAIGVFRGEFGSTHGYAVMWPVISLPVLASVPILRMLQLRGEASA